MMPGRRGGALLWIFGLVAISEAFRPPQRLQTSMMADNQDKKKAPRKEVRTTKVFDEIVT